MGEFWCKQCFLYSSPRVGWPGLMAFSHCQNNFVNAVHRRSRWKRSLHNMTLEV